MAIFDNSDVSKTQETPQTVGFWIQEILKPCAKTTMDDVADAFRSMLNREQNVQAFASASSAFTRGYSAKDDIYS